MWSHLYWYYEIRGNKNYSQRLLTTWELILEEDDDNNENVVLREVT
jgi:hypothetical protein